MFLEDKNRNPGVDQTVKNRAAFVTLLRDPSRWPEDFIWNYNACNTCALGLIARTLVPISFDPARLPDPFFRGTRYETDALISNERDAFQSFLGLTDKQYEEIFYNAHWPMEVLRDDITPSHIADLLEAV